MKNPKIISAAAIGTRLVFALTLAGASLSAQHIFEQPPAKTPVDIAPGVNFPQVVHTVADLDKSIKWYTAIQFKLTQAPTPWTVDEALNKLANTPGAESRTAILTVRTPDAGVPRFFTLVLRQYRGVARQDWSKPQPTDEEVARSQSRNATAFLADLGLADQLPAGLGRFSVMQDLDGLVFNARAVSDGLEVTDFSTRPRSTPQAEQLQDINANYTSFQVKNIDAVYAQAKEYGADIVTGGGIVNYDNGRAVLLRDPYLHSFLMLWQPAK